MNAAFGRRLGEREYEQRMIALHDDPSPSLSKRQEEVLRRQELELTIDHKLGVNFPADRREALWKAQQRVRRRHIAIVLAAYLRKALGSRRSLEEALLRLLVNEYRKVLTPSELRTMLDLPEGNSIIRKRPDWRI